MIRFKKLPAYTLSEVLVVLALTAIVAALSFSALGFVKRSLGLIETNYEFANAYRSLELEISNDFAKSEYISTRDSNTLVISNPVETIEYEFGNEFLIKNKDTLYTGPIDVEFYRVGTSTQKGIVDAMKLIFSVNDKTSLFITSLSSSESKLAAFGN
ncbi:PulJ/GspJ family protein [Gilvibacter sediminis]|uniref:PulJ/GspJ family protein n=1 Tax=Gilvibacter sediminis TaxID=379071 RepID=UPI002350C5AF|nr:type II secretion system protein [Gilvibacter sediminis]MDC7996890.1 type II secretion system protein [Gilvibacter sediminis]